METDTVKAQGMAQALDMFEQTLGGLEDGNDSKTDYEARLKADMVAILEDLDLKIDEMYEPQFSKEGMDGFYWAQGLFKDLVQEEINAFKEAADDQSGAG